LIHFLNCQSQNRQHPPRQNNYSPPQKNNHRSQTHNNRPPPNIPSTSNKSPRRNIRSNPNEQPRRIMPSNPNHRSHNQNKNPNQTQSINSHSMAKHETSKARSKAILQSIKRYSRPYKIYTDYFKQQQTKCEDDPRLPM